MAEEQLEGTTEAGHEHRNPLLVEGDSSHDNSLHLQKHPSYQKCFTNHRDTHLQQNSVKGGSLQNHALQRDKETFLAENTPCCPLKWHILYLRALKTPTFTICKANKDNIQNILIENNCLEYKRPNLQRVGLLPDVKRK